ESPPRRRRRPIVSQRAKFDLAFDDPEIEIMHETTIAAHLAELALLRPNPLTVDDLVIAPSHRLASPAAADAGFREKPSPIGALIAVGGPFRSWGRTRSADLAATFPHAAGPITVTRAAGCWLNVDGV